jgi:hypothetical protein
VKGVPFERIGIALAVVTLGGSQIFFNIIRGNRDHFPTVASFHLWVVFWVQLLPAAFLFGLDLLVERGAGAASRGFRLWRGFLYGLTALLLLRQAAIYYGRSFYAVIPSWAVLPAYAATLVGVALLSCRRPLGADRYTAVLGLLAPLLAGQYLVGTRPAATPEQAVDAGPANPGPPVVLLIFDEWGLDSLVKDGSIDRARFPRLAAVADEGVWFREAVTNYSITDLSMAALVTGHRQPDPAAPAFFSRLRGTHRVSAHIAWPILRHLLRARGQGPGDLYGCRIDAKAFRLGPFDVLSFMKTLLLECAVLSDEWTSPAAVRLPPPDLWDVWSDVDVLRSETASFMDLLGTDARRGRILYWHCSLPHMPFRTDADGRRHGRGHDHFQGPGGDSPRVYANYLEAARGVDRLIGLVVDGLKAAGIYDETVLIITSDHGVRTNGAMPPENTIRVPLIMRGPPIRPGVSDADYQHIDFAPTVLDLLGVPAESGAFEGRSAFGSAKEDRVARFDRGPAELRRARLGDPWIPVKR